MQYLRIFIVVCLGLLLPACAGRLPLSLVGSRAEVAPEWSRWTVVQGGLMDDPARCARASRAVSRLTDGRWDVHAHVLDNAAMTAYSYADGHVFVTRGLVDAASDDELAAALAHELGHLLSDRHLPRGEYAAFIGRTDATDKEVQADAVGSEVLRAHGISPRALIRVLEKVERATHSDATSKALLVRIAMLRGGVS